MTAVGVARPPVALVHDYLTQRGGAERVVLSMLGAFPGAPLHTSLLDPAGTYAEFADVDVRVLPLDRIGLLRRHHRLALPALAPSFSRLVVEADVVLCSSSGWAHGARTDGRKVVYCHSPAKWLHAPDRYFSGGWSASRMAVSALRPPLARWDLSAARSADRYLVNSTLVQRWVQEVYGIDAEVLWPPHGVQTAGAAEPVASVEPGFLLCVSRLMTYKNVDAVIAALATLPDERLVVVGTGPLAEGLQAQAPANVTMLGEATDAQLRWLYRECAGLVAAAYEDFGLTPVEAAAFGKPVAALRWGGYLDTVRDDETGVLFDRPEPALIAAAVARLSARRWDAAALRTHAQTFAVERFHARLRQVVAEEAAR